MTRFTGVNGVLFTEDMLDIAYVAKIEAVAPTQNTPLNKVKEMLAQKALDLGCNGVIGYSYKQKADNPFLSFRWDTERLKASGYAVRFEQDPRT